MKGFNISKFLGVNKTDNPQDLKPYECTDIQNVRITSEKILKRAGWTDVGTIGAVTRSLQSMRGILVATHGTICEKLVTTTWTTMNLTGLSATNKTKFVEFPIAVAKGTPISATITSISSNGLVVTASAASWGVNDYVGDIVRLSGQAEGAGQYRKIVLNTATALTLSEPLNVNTTQGNTLNIEDPTDGTLFFNGETPRKTVAAALDSWANFVNTGYTFAYATVYKNRVVGYKASSHTVFVSPIGIGEDFPYEFEIAAGTADFITGIEIFGDQLVVHKGDSGVWIGESDDTVSSGAVFSFIQRADGYGALLQQSIAVGENIMFYVSSRGIEWFNPLEVNELEGHKALSDYKVPELRDSTNTSAFGITFDAKYYCYINSKTYIFDIARYLQLRDGQQQNPYAFLIDTGTTPLIFEVHDGVLYAGAASNIWSHTGTLDDTKAITSFWEKDGITYKQPSRTKALKRITCRHSGGATTDNITITATTEDETKELDTMTFATNVEHISGQRTKGKSLKIKFDITNIATGSLENAELITEIGKL